MRKLIYSPNAWLDYISWQKSNKAIQLRIDELTKEICKNPQDTTQAIPLKFEMSNIWTRKINFEQRLVYKVTTDSVQIIQCRYHY